MTEIEFYIMDNELGVTKRRYRQAHVTELVMIAQISFFFNT